ncbi:25S rRNA (adenine(645)-N(1))-methyltransferase protein [Dioscorea alata]|uniref:25S rRNA (Adenine(645)-N(1))-methyltransferase protein n=1 Tax=Dioscorea alata TaxID=55571 RepID=A0ACB7VAA0_DIOAL|nr:25S rRNA (adenine(645)-N(1))-methyltransferase protein [Dioscorea alata]
MAGEGKRRTRRGKRKRHSRNNASPSLQKEEQPPISPPLRPSRPPKRSRVEPPAPNSMASSSFLDKIRGRLSGAHFRMINEKLYTCSGSEALDLFKKDPELFDVYHAGYQEQMSHWPEQPVNIIIKWLKNHSSSMVVADFGCGSATLAKNVKNKVFSIDLVANDPSVIACDMSHTPLDSSSVDVAVFCLSLMGTNFSSYLQEANRVLKPCGWLLIAEVRSRFDPNNGGADPDKFCEAVCKLGYTSVLKDLKNKMFLLFYFKKKEKAAPVKYIEWPELKACLYKRR